MTHVFQAGNLMYAHFKHADLEDEAVIVAWFHRVLEARGTVHGPVHVEVKKTRDRNDRGQACYRWVGTVATRGIDGGGSLFGEPVEVHRAAGSRANAVRETWKAATHLFADLLRSAAREGTLATAVDSRGAEL